MTDSWVELAECAKYVDDFGLAAVESWYFPDRTGPRGYDWAREICEGCAAASDCRQYAVDHQIHDGMFGGLTPREREPSAGKRRPARTAKTCPTCRVEHPLADFPANRSRSLGVGGECRWCARDRSRAWARTRKRAS